MPGTVARRPPVRRTGLRRRRRRRARLAAGRRARTSSSPTRSPRPQALATAPRGRGPRRRSSASPARSARPAPRRRSSPRSTAIGRARSIARSRATTTIPACRSASRGCRATREFARVRDGHEPCRRDCRTDPPGPPARRASSPPSPPRTSRIFGSMEAIADAKAEIFEGLEPGGIAIVPYDTPHRDRLVKAARRHAERDHHLRRRRAPTSAPSTPSRAESGGSLITARLLQRELTFTISPARASIGCRTRSRCSRRSRRSAATLPPPGLALADLGGLEGRGERHCDRARRRRGAADRRKLQRQSGLDGRDAQEPRRRAWRSRRIAVLGAMRELGEHGAGAPRRPCPGRSRRRMSIG